MRTSKIREMRNQMYNNATKEENFQIASSTIDNLCFIYKFELNHLFVKILYTQCIQRVSKCEWS